MTKRPGHVTVTIEVGFCSFCSRPRNLRREEHHMGGLVRTIVACETCHRFLSSTMGAAADAPDDTETAAAPAEPAAKPPASPAPKKAARARTTDKPAARKPAASRPAAKKAASPSAAAAKAKAKPKPAATKRTVKSR